MKHLFIGGVSALALFAGVSSASASDGCDSGEIVIKFAHVVAATGHPKGDAATELAKRVNSEMDGKACMEVYPNSTLYDDDKALEALLLGDLQIAAPSLSKFEAYTLKYRVYDLPFLFNDLAAVERFDDSETGKGLLKVMEDQGYVGLGYWLSGMKQFSANKPLLLPSDGKGLKFRIQTSDVSEAMIDAMGASPQKLAFSEVYGALQSGVVDGQENSWSNIYTQKFYEVQDGISETNHAALAYLLVTSTEWLNGLEPDVRDQFMKIVEEVTKDANAKVAAVEAKNRQNIIDAGAKVRELTDDQRKQWVDTMKPVWDQFRDDIGEDVIDAAMKANDSGSTDAAAATTPASATTAQ